MIWTLTIGTSAPFRWLHQQPAFLEAVQIFKDARLFQHIYERGVPAVREYAGWQSKQSWLLDSMVNDGSLDPWQFVRAATKISHPLETALKLGAENAKAAAWIVANHETAIELRSKAQQMIAEVSKRLLDPLSVFMKKWQLPTAALVAGDFRFATVEALTCAMGFTDISLAECFLHGFAPVFECPDSGTWKPQEKKATEGFSRADNDAWTSKLSTRIQKLSEDVNGERAKTMWAVWEKTLAEEKKGYCMGPFSRSQLDNSVTGYGWGKWRPIGRNGIWQNGRCRCVDDAAISGHNAATTTHETIVCSGPDFPVRAACEFAKLHGKPVMMWCGMDDLEAAYRRVPNANPGYTVVAVWNPVDKKVVYFKLPGFNFGLVSAVVSFNRLPRFCCALTRQFFGVVCEHFFDDYCVAEPSYMGRSGAAALDFVHRLIHFPLAPEKHQIMGPINVFLGVCTNFAHIVSEGVAIMSMREQMMDDVVADFRSVVETKKLTKGHASRLRGQCQFIGNAIFGRVGRAPMQALSDRQYQKGADTSVTGELLEALLLIIQLLKALPPRRIKVMPKARKKALLIWSDAMWETKETGARRQRAAAKLGKFKAQLGFVVFDPEHNKYYHSFMIVGNEVISKFVPGKGTYIGQLEALAAAAVYSSLPREVLEDRYALHWVDNTSAVAGLIKGYSSKSDTGRILNALQFLLAGLSCVPWFAYVPSGQNVADAPSRGEFQELLDVGSELLVMKLPEFNSWLDPVRSKKAKRGKRSKR